MKTDINTNENLIILEPTLKNSLEFSNPIRPPRVKKHQYTSSVTSENPDSFNVDLADSIPEHKTVQNRFSSFLKGFPQTAKEKLKTKLSNLVWIKLKLLLTSVNSILRSHQFHNI